MCPAENAVDGIWTSEEDLWRAVRAESDDGSRWSTLFSSTHSQRGSWLHVDLGESFDIESVVREAFFCFRSVNPARVVEAS